MAAMVERPASLDDMRRCWPDKTDAQLQAAYAEIMDMGGVLTVTCGDPDDDDDMESAE